MDLKFTFGGASPDHSHGHGDAPSGIPLPFSTTPSSASGELLVVARLSGETLVAEALSGDGVSYAHAEIEAAAGGQDPDPAALARAAKSAISRAVAELEGPLADAITALTLDLGGAEAAVAEELGLDPSVPVVDAALQRRIGINAGTKVRLGG
ncbi:hypothetical protein [Leucobacter luti]|uniref:hypothetical protein n=1 Tax=Leucobacter luti TaxID=340320 RepID=UPI003CFEAF63